MLVEFRIFMNEVANYRIVKLVTETRSSRYPLGGRDAYTLYQLSSLVQQYQSGVDFRIKNIRPKGEWTSTFPST